MRGTPISLPPCGIFVGSGVYPTSADCLLLALYAHQSWSVQDYTPAEMIDKLITDRQGNLAQVWGHARGYAAKTYAEWYYALDELGISVPPPDWERGEHLFWKDEPAIQAHPERRGAGLLRFIREAAARGIYTALLYTDAHPQWPPQFHQHAPYYLGYDFGERFTFRLDDATLNARPLSEITLTMLADDLLARVRAHVNERQAAGWGNVMATSSNFHLDYEIIAGADIPVVEDFAFCHLHLASALSRGLYHQFALPFWGSHLAHEHYSWLPLASPHKFPLLRAACFLKYLGGSKMIINESGNWFVEASLCEDSPKHGLPAVPLTPAEVGWGGSSQPKHLPYIAEARQYYPTINYHSEVCRRYRAEIAAFYDFVCAHGTPTGQPATSLAIVKGNLDLACHRFMPNYAIGGAFKLADANPNWYEGQPERAWEAVRQVFFPLPPLLGPYPNLFLSGAPHGLVDLVSFADPELNASRLARYRTLLFAGWNTATERQYQTLLDFARGGGTVFLGIAHLSTNDRRGFASYQPSDLLRGGDFSELCGARVKGPGARFYWATPPRGSSVLGCRFPRRFGILSTRLGDTEITDPSAEILLVDDELARPLLWRRRCGAGVVYFLNSWDHPGALTSDDGPGGRLGTGGLLGTIYRHLAEATRGPYWLSSLPEGPGHETLSLAYFPESDHLALFNADLDHPRAAQLHGPHGQQTLTLAAAEFRLLRASDYTPLAQSLPPPR